MTWGTKSTEQPCGHHHMPAPLSPGGQKHTRSSFSQNPIPYRLETKTQTEVNWARVWGPSILRGMLCACQVGKAECLYTPVNYTPEQLWELRSYTVVSGAEPVSRGKSLHSLCEKCETCHKLYLLADTQVFLHFNSSNTPQKPATYQSTSWTRRTNTSTEMNMWPPGVKAVRQWLRRQNLETSCHGHVSVLCFQMRDRYTAAAHLSHTLKHNWREESLWMTGSNNHWKRRPEPVWVFIYTVKLYNVIFHKHSAIKQTHNQN